MKTKLSLNLLVIALALCVVGCNKSALRKTIDSLPFPDEEEKEEEESEFQTPAKMVVTWTDTVLQRAGSSPTRGFGGRIYFYNDNSQAIPVEGDLIVYAFDDSNPDSPERKAEKKFVFSAESFTEHYSKTDLGASYSVWLPFGPLGGEERAVSLLPVFRTKAEKVVLGAQTKNVLPGVKQASVIDADNGGYLRSARQKPLLDAQQVTAQMQKIQTLRNAGMASQAGHIEVQSRERQASQVAYHQPMRDFHAAAPEKMKTATIGLPNSMAKRVLRPIEPAEQARRIHSWNRHPVRLGSLDPAADPPSTPDTNSKSSGRAASTTPADADAIRAELEAVKAGPSTPPVRFPAGPSTHSVLDRSPVQVGLNAQRLPSNGPSLRRLGAPPSFRPSQQ